MLPTLRGRTSHLGQRLVDQRLVQDLCTLFRLPRVRIDLMYAATADNDPFFARVVHEFYDETRQRHPKLLLTRQLRHGVAVCRLPPSFDEYFTMIEASARRNHRKAARNGYRCERIDFNRYSEDIREIRRSTNVRQGELPEHLLSGTVGPCTDPPSRLHVHDYPWFGVLRDGKLVAYAGCMVAGQLCSIDQIFGHAAFQHDGVVPMLIISIAEFMYRHHPHVRYYSFGTFFGASASLRRFKKKMGFLPHRVDWVLGDSTGARSPDHTPTTDLRPVQVTLGVPDNIAFQVVYRQRRNAPLSVKPVPGAAYHYVPGLLDLVGIQRAARRHLPPRELLKTGAKLLTQRRSYYCVILDDEIVSDGWVTVGWCRYYHVEAEDAVIGPVWTHPNHQGHGLASFALACVVNSLYERGYAVSYIDTFKGHATMERVITRCGYGQPVALYLRGYQSPSPSRG